MNCHQPQRVPGRGMTSPRGLFVRGLAAVVGSAMFCASVVSCLAADSPGFKEHELKAAFLYNFTKFIEWPTNRFADTNAPFVVAVVDDGPLTTELEQVANSRKVGGRVLIIKQVKAPAEMRGVHMVFFHDLPDSRVKEWLTAAHAAGVLTVGESEAFFKQGGMINFLLEGEKIRFEINVDQTETAGLKISAQLQKLAKSVRHKQ
jgi:hypothetical protein